MNNKVPNNIGIIREIRSDENRAPLAPIHINYLKNQYPNLNVIVQPSTTRCFTDNEYKNSGAIINENLSDCTIIFGVKEVDINFLIDDKTYIFFSHTYKLNNNLEKKIDDKDSKDKKDLLKSILKKKIKLIDYENIRNKNTQRYLGFGKFAGIIGCYNTLNLCLERFNKLPLARAFKINSYEKIINNLRNLYFPNMKILVTGDGRVAKGVVELLKYTNIKQVSKEEFKNLDSKQPIFCNLKTKDYVITDTLNNFDLDHFIKNPKKYKSNSLQYLKLADVLISAHYWDPQSPKIFEKKDLHQLNKLKVIGDITCDIHGSIPTTIRSSTIENPNYFINRDNFEETNNSDECLSIMAVDNLPSELPRDSSHEFGNSIVNEVIPYLLKKDDGRILNATITSKGSFLEKYDYLEDYIYAK